jgi:hypothetical protein
MHPRHAIVTALASALVLAAASDGRAQVRYPYRYSDEPLMSINRSYLGYSNFVDYGPGLPAHANPPPRGGYPAPYAAPRTPAYVQAPQRPRTYVPPPAPTQATIARQPVYYVQPRRARWFGWWR